MATSRASIRHYRDDDGFFAWLEENPDGCFINTERNPKPNYLVLYRPTCPNYKSGSQLNWTKAGGSYGALQLIT